MGNKDVIKKFMAGLFFVCCVGLIALFVFVLGVEKGFTEPKFQMTVLFQKVGGLVVGAPVRLSGVTVGTVADMSFLEHEVDGRGVKVTLNLFEKYKPQLVKSASIAIITEGVLGEKVVEITTAPDFVRQDLSAAVIGKDPLDVQNLAETFGETAVNLNEMSKTIDSMIGELQNISATTKRLLNRIEERVIDGSLFKVF